MYFMNLLFEINKPMMYFVNYESQKNILCLKFMQKLKLFPQKYLPLRETIQKLFGKQIFSFN